MAEPGSSKKSPRPKPQSDKNRVIAAELIAKAWQDPVFKAKLLADPKQALVDAGVDDLPAPVSVVAVENTADVKYVVLPDEELLPAYEQQLLRLVRGSLPLPDGAEMRMVQNTKLTRYLVIPLLPPGAPAKLDASHVQLLAAAGWEAINLYTSANIAGEANIAGVANVAGATEVAGVAVAVAVIGVVLI